MYLHPSQACSTSYSLRVDGDLVVLKSRLLIMTAHGGSRLLKTIQSVALIVFSWGLAMKVLGAQSSVLCFIFAGVDVDLVVVNVTGLE